MREPEEKITVVLLEPGKLARVAEIDSSFEGMQNAVKGNIESAYYFDEDVCLICNDEGKINGMPLNRTVYGQDKEMLDIIAGTAFICGCSGENFSSLSKEQLTNYQEQFKYPERFFRGNNEIQPIPYKPKNKEVER